MRLYFVRSEGVRQFFATKEMFYIALGSNIANNNVQSAGFCEADHVPIEWSNDKDWLECLFKNRKEAE